MRIAIYVGHPAQYHFFRQTIAALKSRGHTIKLLAKTKDVLIQLLDFYGEEYINVLPGGRTDSAWGIVTGLLKREFQLFKHMRNFHPDIVLGTDPALAHVSRLLHIPCITCLEDDYDVIPQLAKITYPFTTKIFAPHVCDVGKFTYKKIGYEGYMKLAYLHPRYFTPKRSIVEEVTSEPFYLIRLSKLKAYHDKGIGGISGELLGEIIKKLEQQGKGQIFISSEGGLAPEYKQYVLNIHPAHIHHFLHFAELLISDSQSMSVEAAVLGTPSIRISGFTGRIGVLEELEHRYGLTFGFKPENSSLFLQKIDEILNMNEPAPYWETKRQNMLSEKIDVTALLVETVVSSYFLRYRSGKMPEKET